MSNNIAEAYVLDDQDLSIAFPALIRGLTTKKDVQYLVTIIRRILDSNNTNVDHTPLLSVFYDELIKARSLLPPHVLALEQTLPHDWFHSPWYIAYVQYTGTANEDAEGNFETLSRMLPYIRNHLGFRNIYLLPHYESSMADGGYDVSQYTVRKTLGGESDFMKFMKDASGLGMCVITEGIFNHTSTEHEWFQKAIQGDQKYLHYYVQRNGREKIAEWENENNQVICQYRDINGFITERRVVFPKIDRTHGLWVEISGMTYQFYRSFHPFQIDLNLKNIDLLREILQILSYQIRLGILGIKLNASNYWIKKPKYSSLNNLDECYSLHAFFKIFLKHLHKRVALIPEIKHDVNAVTKFAGKVMKINNSVSSSQADGVFNFEMQAALRETIYLQTVAPLWRIIFDIQDKLHNYCIWLNLLENHDDIQLDFYQKGEMRRWIAEFIQSRNGTIYNNGINAAGRIMDGLGGDERRLASAIALLYLMPGTPMVYSGTEIGIGSQWTHATQHTIKRKQTFNKLGVYIEQNSCFDARELHRGPIPKSMFDECIKNDFIGLKVIARMNKIWNTIDGWSQGQLKPVMCDDMSVFVAVRECKNNISFLCVINLSSLSKDLEFPINQLENAVNGVGKAENDTKTFKNLLDENDIIIKFSISTVQLSVEPFARIVTGKSSSHF